MLKSWNCISMTIGQLEVENFGSKVCLGEILLDFQHWRGLGRVSDC